MPLLSPEMMRALELDAKKLSELMGADHPIFFVSAADLLFPDREVYFCETCDEMVEIGRLSGFVAQSPWRKDIIKFGAKSVRKSET